ncbi:YdcF family protein [Luteibacter yeojuensis]|uniref:YdcF family protein n=1 Tax=Luteibacter yeojuensis TaxID=345309 RepID=A0A7X5QXN0_9GAMM|nr:YdcF family protein [Luteibacter yeojuensis]NID17202.1 YdcF family protein [Luteibacter yeojuensis]
MTLILFLILLVAGLVLLARHRPRGGWVFSMLALAWLCFAGCGPLTGLLLDRLQAGFASDVSRWGQRNAIVLLGAGTVRGSSGTIEPSLYANGRILRAAQLYHACKATGAECKLEVSGGDAMKLKQPEADVYAFSLDRLGVPRGDLILEGRSMNTFQNAQFSRPLLAAYGADKVVLVSSAVHLKRVALYFAHFGIHGEAVRGDYVRARYGWLPTSENLSFADFAIHEYIGVARYRLYNALGWNVPKVPEESVTAQTHT